MSRIYIPQNYKISTWEGLQPFFEELNTREINDKESFVSWLKDLSELESIVSEDLAWRYIKMTCDTSDKELEASYISFVNDIQPNIAPYDDVINKKIAASPYTTELEKDQAYFIYMRGVRNAIELFREENIPLQTEIQTLSQQYGSITGAMSVEIDGRELTLQQASNILKETNRERRQMAYEVIAKRRLQDKDSLDELFDKLIALRHQVAVNAGFDNFRDYMHQAMGRFDYSIQDCLDFHEAIKKIVVPLNKALQEKRKNLLGVETLKPYDLAVDPEGKQPLKPFEDGKELLEKSIACFNGLDKSFGENLTLMGSMKFLDLDSRIGKAPGGYNYPLAETGVP
ncbi:MAG: M3 family oligoendopeptidase, partial [Bacteroidia bacterium]|nr:M3 family oligoendopeptidase [Bacteroidia bacterium]